MLVHKGFSHRNKELETNRFRNKNNKCVVRYSMGVSQTKINMCKY